MLAISRNIESDEEKSFSFVLIKKETFRTSEVCLECITPSLSTALVISHFVCVWRNALEISYRNLFFAVRKTLSMFICGRELHWVRLCATRRESFSAVVIQVVIFGSPLHAQTILPGNQLYRKFECHALKIQFFLCFALLLSANTPRMPFY